MAASTQAHIYDLMPYQPGLPIELVAREYGLEPENIVKLASNENPLGMSPKAAKAIKQAVGGAHRYPEQYALIQALSKKLGVGPEHIVLGNGSNDVLDLVARVYLGQGTEAISSEYAFAIYKIITQAVGAKNVIVPAEEYGHNLDAMLAAITPATKVIWIANPNNPTGAFVPYKQLEKFLDRAPTEVIMVVDEAYYEYLEPKDRADTVAWVKKYPNLIITRTFSKIYGLAGLRLGYAIASPEATELLNRVRQPFNVNPLAIAAAVASLGDDAFVQKSYKVNQKGQQQLLDGLKVLKLHCLPAYGNFVTFKVPDAAGVNQKLLEQGIIVRPLAGYGMPEWLRVTVGLPRENTSFLAALSSITSA